jgi:multiple sugar transport system ATP-binding protein
MARIEFDNISKRYVDGHLAVKNLSISMPDGEFLVLVGPSGCGKSTALRIVAGLEDISEGALRIEGRVVNDLAPRDRDVAMVFQSYALYPHLTVRQNIGFGLRVRGADKATMNETIEKTAHLLELQDHLDRKPGHLSGGQRQRVAMGRAIVRRPAAFLMDEPLSNLDAKLRVSMRAEITRIQRMTKTTTIYVTHDQVEAMTMGDRVAVMAKGELQQIGPPRDLYDAPVNLFVASFIGSPSMNLIRTKLDDAAASFQLQGQAMTLPDGDLRRRLAPHAGRDVVIGIRPEHFALAPESQADLTLSAQATMVEHLGATQLVHLQAGISGDATVLLDAESQDDMSRRRGELLAILDTDSDVRESTGLRLSVPEHRVHVFDADSGAALT